MTLTPEIRRFIHEHLNDNTDRLLLNTKKYPEVDVYFAVDQIIARRQIKDKLPSWFANDKLVYPSRISTEQCSSEVTAHYKRRLAMGECLCDLTGGLGIDTSFFARQMKKVVYIERFPEYCQCAAANFNTLGINNIQVMQGDALFLAGEVDADTFYIDPARRAGENKRVFALAECEPDVLQLKPLLLERAQRIIIKISPMADIAETLRLLPETTEVHILSVKNECKELLFVLGKAYSYVEPMIYAVNFTTTGEVQHFSFTPAEEREASLRVAAGVGQFLYEPNSSILKSGAFKLTATCFELEKLHQHSHLYTSDNWVAKFPGRSFRVEEVYEFSGKLLKQIAKTIPRANLTTRNFNLTVAELRKRSGMAEGGAVYVFATTINKQQVLIKCTKCNSECCNF